MRLLGRAAAAAALLALLIAGFLLMRGGAAAALLQRPGAGPSSGGAQPSLAYLLSSEPTLFVFSRPQHRVRIITNAELRRAAMNPRYAFLIEALDEEGQMVWKQAIHVRSVPLAVRGPDGTLMPHAFIRERGAGRLSAGDISQIDFGRPVAAIRLLAEDREAGALRMLVRVQEQRPLSERQREIGWERLSEREQEQLAAGNPLGPTLLSEEERLDLLVRRWSPVGPAGVQGRDYQRMLIYERPGSVVAVTNRRNR